MISDDDIFAEALELPVAERGAFLARVCAGEGEQRSRIEALLAGHEAARTFLEQPLIERPAPAAEEKIGMRLGAYTLIRPIGEGGCGVVWLAEQTAPLRRLVALKVIKLGMDTRHIIARFEAERQTLALMSHPDIARVYDAGATDAGRPYFVMEYVEGVPITRFCDEQSLDMAARLELFARVCLALQHAHQKGIIHRDLKPSNILVARRDGVPAPKVIDFGIAKATAGRAGEATLFTELGQFLGTPAYMSPEQAEQRELDLDTRSDVYALGVLLYELLTGRPPYDPRELVEAGLLEIRRIIREVDPPRPSTVIATLTEADRSTVARLRGAAAPRLSAALRGDLDWIVMRCLEKDRDRRYGTAAALADDVRRHLRQEPVEARPPQASYRLGKFMARNRLACASAAALAASLVLGSVVSTLQAHRATRAERVAAAERDTARAAEKAEATARADAQRRQEQAEDLLTFMLGDFRTELAKIGRLNLLDAVGEKAVAYFTALEPRDLTDPALTRQARALTQIGEVRLDQARFPEAEQAFTAANARATALAARHPRNGDMLFERGQTEFWIGFVARRRGDAHRQREWLARYRDTCLALAATEGATPRAALEVVSGHHNLAVLDLEQDNLAAARTGFLAEETALEQMLATEPTSTDFRSRLANTASWLGTVAERGGRFAEAKAHYEKMGQQYRELMAREPGTAGWRLERAQSLTLLGTLLGITNQGVEAATAYAEAGKLLQELTARDPGNKRWLSLRCRIQLLQAGLSLAEPGTSLPVVVEARTSLETLAAAEPSSVNFARLAALARTLEARILAAQNRPEEAGRAITRARELADPLLQNPQADAWTRHVAGHVLIVAGRLEQSAGRPAAARELWLSACTQLLPPATLSQNWLLLEPAAAAAALAGRATEARPLAARLKNFGFHSIDPLIRAALAEAE